MADDAADGRVVAAADAVDLLDQAGRGLHQPRVQLVALGEAVEIGEGHAVVEVVGAGGEDVLPGRRVLARHHRIERRVEQHRRQAIDQRLHRLAAAQREAGAGRGGGADRRGERLARQIDHELARRQRVIRAGVDPHQLGVADDGRPALLRQRRGVPDQRLEGGAQRQVVAVALVAVDVAAGERGLVEVPGEDLGRGRQRLEAVGVVLDHGGVADAFEEVGPLRGGRGRGHRHPSTCTVSFICGISTRQPSVVPMAVLSASIEAISPCTR